MALLQELIRIDTSNPPGNEEPAQQLLAETLTEAGFDCELLAAEPGRPNLVARLRGRERRADAVPARPRRTRSPPIPPSGASIPGRATSWTARFEAEALRT